jgi:hypothetical protein
VPVSKRLMFGMLGLFGLAAMMWKEYPALIRYVKIERM